MSDEKPSLGDLAIELDDLTWAEVMKMAVILRVEYSELRKIEEKNSEPSPRLLAAMNLWLTTDSRATWGRVVKALRDIKKTVLAQELEDKYCKKPADSPSKDFPFVTADENFQGSGDVAASATSPSPSSTGNGDLLKDEDAINICEELMSAQNHTQFLGLKLGIPTATVDGIHSQYPSPRERLLHVVKEFLKQVNPEPSWSAIAAALRSQVVNLPRLAKHIEEKYCLHNRGSTAQIREDGATATPTQKPPSAAAPTRKPTGPSSSDRPSLPKLLHFPTISGGFINIIEMIGPHYRIFGVLLLNDEQGNIINSYHQSELGKPDAIIQKVFTRWLQGNGRAPRTWETLATVLEEMAMGELASTIKENLT